MKKFSVGDHVIYMTTDGHRLETEITAVHHIGKEVRYSIKGIPVPVTPDKLAHLEESPDFKFNIGDCVKVIGYDGLYEVKARYKRELDGVLLHSYTVVPYGEKWTLFNWLEAFEVDMERMPHPVGGQEFKPVDRRIKKRTQKPRKRLTVKEIYEHIDRKLDLYNMFGDRRYLRHAGRLKQWADKIE